MTSQLALHPLTIAHAEIVATLHKEGFDENWSLNSFQNLLSLPATFGFIALYDNEPSGFILCQGDVVEAEIISIATSTAHRRLGVATHLLEKSHGLTARMFLEVAVDNQTGIQFYLKNGYVEIAKRSNYYKRHDGSKCDAMVMQKET